MRRLVGRAGSSNAPDRRALSGRPVLPGWPAWSRRALGAGTVCLLAGCGIGGTGAEGPGNGDAASSAPGGQVAGTGSAAEPPSSDIGIGVVPDGEPRAVAEGLEAPWSVTFHGDTALISLRDSGDVLELLADGGTRVVGTIDDVSPDGEAGLLGIVVDDDGHLYAYSTTADENRVQRYDLTSEAGSLGLGEPTTLLDGIPRASIHDGGRLALGPDGMLYVTTGDAGNGDSAQDLDSLAGKILRMTPTGEVPPDNPFEGSPVYSYGHRNVQGLDWTDDGALFASEFGESTWDELNLIEPGGNYGWPEVEGIGNVDEYIDPVQQWGTSEASPSGLEIVGDTIFVANLRGSVLRAIPVAAPERSTKFYADRFGRLRDVTTSPDGDLWFLTSNTDGRGHPAPQDDRLLAVPLGTE